MTLWKSTTASCQQSCILLENLYRSTISQALQLLHAFKASAKASMLLSVSMLPHGIYLALSWLPALHCRPQLPDITKSSTQAIFSAEGEAEDTGSEASALSHWDELDGQASSSSLSDWGDHNTEAGSAEVSSPQMPQIPQDSAAEKHSKTAKLLQLGQLDTKTKAAKLSTNSSGVRLGLKHHRSPYHLHQRKRLAVSGCMIHVIVVSK